MVKVAFIHPDMGIGGAEQLVVNLAMLCKNNNWDVKIYTPYFDKNRCFDQLKTGALSVQVVGNWFPRRIFGRCQALCEYIRFFIVSLYLLFFGSGIDLVIADQITFSLPILCLRYKTFFYCHYPDKLLCVERKSILKKVYRFFIDLIEELCLLFAGVIVVNSNFTKRVFKQSFKIVSFLRKPPQVLFPCTDLSNFDRYNSNKEDLLKIKGLEKLKELYSKDKEAFNNDYQFIVTLNRYERKKNLPLAADAYIQFIDLVENHLKKNKENSISDGDSIKKETNYFFITAGGFDERLNENAEVYNVLKDKDYQIKDNTFFLRSISNEERCILLKNADVVLYTPKNEHFGIVPCEAMYCGAAVIAHKSGGPIETVSPETGFLLENEDSREWGKKIFDYFNGNKISKKTLREYIIKNYSLERMNVDFVNMLNTKWPKAGFSMKKKN